VGTEHEAIKKLARTASGPEKLEGKAKRGGDILIYLGKSTHDFVPGRISPQIKERDKHPGQKGNSWGKTTLLI